MSKATVLLLVFAAGIIILAALIGVIFGARERARAAGFIPPSRRPGPTDEALEGRLLETYQLAGAGLTIFLALLLPFLYVHEPTRQREAAAAQAEESVARGHATFEDFCARCHGVNATGGTVKRFVPANNPKATPVDYQAPNLHEIWKRHPDENVAQVAWQTIQLGRPGTPMPTWGVRYGGPMNDQQITDLVNFLLSIQSDGKQRPQLQFQGLGGSAEHQQAVALGRFHPNL
jgi:mono/diheme cytochrome c family protein